MRLTKLSHSLLLLFLLSQFSFADDWPCWRGPNHNGISNEKNWRDQWPKDGPAQLWKAKVGIGFSSVVVSNKHLLTIGHSAGQDTVYCLNAETGKQIWSHSWKSRLGANLFEGGPVSTPTIEKDLVYVQGRWGEVFCFDLKSGKQKWTTNLAKETEVPVPTWGFSGSPLVLDDLLLLNAGESGIALDRMTGKVKWTSEKEEAGYSSPVPLKQNGKQLAIFSSTRAYFAVDVQTGKIVWQQLWITRYGINAADPIVEGENFFLSTGYGKGATVLKLGKEKPTQVWRDRKAMRNQLNSSVLIDGYVYGIDGDTGKPTTTLRCIDMKTGKLAWSFKGVGGGSLMAADGKLIVLSASGELMVGKASPKGFTPTARAKVLQGKCWTVPVLANGQIYCRNASGDLVCLNVRGEQRKK